MTLNQPSLIIKIVTHFIRDTVFFLQSPVGHRMGNILLAVENSVSQTSLLYQRVNLGFFYVIENFFMRFRIIGRFRMERTLGDHLVQFPAPSKRKSS